MLFLLLVFVCSARNHENNHHSRPEGRPNHSRPNYGNHGSNQDGPRSNHEGHGNRPNGIGGPNGRENWGFSETLFAQRRTTTPALESTELSFQGGEIDTVVTEELQDVEEHERLTSPPTNFQPSDSATSTVQTTRYTNGINAYTETTNTAHLLEAKEESEPKSKYTDLHIAAIALGFLALTMFLVSILVISCCEVDSSNIDLGGPVKELQIDQEGAKTDVAEIDVKKQKVILEINEEGGVELKV